MPLIPTSAVQAAQRLRTPARTAVATEISTGRVPTADLLRLLADCNTEGHCHSVAVLIDALCLRHPSLLAKLDAWSADLNDNRTQVAATLDAFTAEGELA